MGTPKITVDQRQAVSSQPGDFTRVEDDETNKVYFLIEESKATELFDHWLRTKLIEGAAEADRGELIDWDLDGFLARMHRQHDEMTANDD